VFTMTCCIFLALSAETSTTLLDILVLFFVDVFAVSCPAVVDLFLSAMDGSLVVELEVAAAVMIGTDVVLDNGEAEVDLNSCPSFAFGVPDLALSGVLGELPFERLYLEEVIVSAVQIVDISPLREPHGIPLSVISQTKEDGFEEQAFFIVMIPVPRMFPFSNSGLSHAITLNHCLHKYSSLENMGESAGISWSDQVGFG